MTREGVYVDDLAALQDHAAVLAFIVVEDFAIRRAKALATLCRDISSISVTVLSVLRDKKGVELSSLEDAKALAVQRARDEISECSKHGTLGLNRSFEILDGGG